MAYKYQAERAETRLLDIQIQIGRTGVSSRRSRSWNRCRSAGRRWRGRRCTTPTRSSARTSASATWWPSKRLGEIIPAVVLVRTDLRTGTETDFQFPRDLPVVPRAGRARPRRRGDPLPEHRMSRAGAAAVAAFRLARGDGHRGTRRGERGTTRHARVGRHSIPDIYDSDGGVNSPR